VLTNLCGSKMNIERWKSGAVLAAFVGYEIASWATFAKLTFFDGYVYTWWNWLIAWPVNIFLGQIWPIYWLILQPIFGS
jgi:hypothetical protein